jgi:hypothetical protein
MKVSELRTEMQAEFRNVRTEMHAEFENVRAEFANVRVEMRVGVDDLRAELMAAMTAEGETTRRHFDVVAEQSKDFLKVLADGSAGNTERLDDHEKRITMIEGSSS